MEEEKKNLQELMSAIGADGVLPAEATVPGSCLQPPGLRGDMDTNWLHESFRGAGKYHFSTFS